MLKRKKAQGITPGMNSMLGAGGSEKQWEYAPEPGRLGTRLLMAAAIRIGVLTVFETHVYAFGGHEFKQSDGGPIGLRFTGVLARIRVNHWANKVINILESNNIKVLLAKSYVVDFRFILHRITGGLRYIPEVEEFIYDPKYDKDYAHLTSTEYTSMILGQLMNSIT